MVLEVGKIAFVEAGVVPAPYFSQLQMLFAGAGNTLVPSTSYAAVSTRLPFSQYRTNTTFSTGPEKQCFGESFN